MIQGDYFFLFFLGTIAVTRLLLLSKKGSPTIKGFRLRHYMYGLILIMSAFIFDNLTVYAIGLGLFVDELPLILVKGPGHREEHWRGCDDYYIPWCISSVLILIFIVYVFRSLIAGLL